jgi:gas vesicle protein
MDVNSHPSGAILMEKPNYQPGIKSKSYRLNEELFLNPGERWVVLGSNAEKRLFKFEQDGIMKYENFKSTYQFLLDKYESDITIDNEAMNYVSNLKSLLLERVDKFDGDKDEMTKRVNDNIKEMESKISAIQKKKFRPSVSKSNHRLNSVITNLNRELRYYLKINGNRLVEVDLKSSQPYVLGSILTDRFFSGDTIIDYSLIKIYPQLYKQLNYIVSKSSTDITSLIGNSIYNNKEGLPKYFMSGDLDNCPEIQSYRNLPFKEGFYSHLNMTFFNGDFGTQKVKEDIMLVLNLKELEKRKHIELIQQFKIHFPNINSFIESVNNLNVFKSAVAILLQRSESYLFLLVGCKAVNEQLPNVPFLTIHDSILIEEQYSELVTPILKDRLNSFTRIEPGVSVKVIEDPIKRLEANIEEIWNDIIKK